MAAVTIYGQMVKKMNKTVPRHKERLMNTLLKKILKTAQDNPPKKK